MDEVPSLQGSPTDHAAAVRVELGNGDVAAARARIDPVLERYHDVGDLWALRVLLEKQAGDDVAARGALLEAAKLDVDDAELLAEVLTGVGMSEREWQLLRRPFQAPDLAEGELRCCRYPGARLVPTPGSTPHRYGGDPPFEMPDCAGCGHPIRAWFTIDLAAVPALQALAPSSAGRRSAAVGPASHAAHRAVDLSRNAPLLSPWLTPPCRATPRASGRASGPPTALR